ncbi:MAG: type II secretion system F family protein [Syntrophomonas sp.]
MDIVLASFTGFTISALMLGFLFSINREKILVRERLQRYTWETENDNIIPELVKPLNERILLLLLEVLKPVSKKIVPSQKKQAYARKLRLAGNPWGLTPESYMLIKYIFILIMLVSGAMTRSSLYLGCFFIIGLIIPEFMLKSAARKRREQILKSLPDMLDLLGVSVEAGLGFDAALQKVVEKFRGPLKDEFERTLQEINLGKPRREALRDMGERVNVDDLTTFLASIIQAEQLGVGIGNVLRIQSAQIRANRRMRAEEKAQQAPVKILIPLLLFIFPTILIVLLGPAVIQLMETFN